MSVNIAKNYYLGKEGYSRMNCAQSVISAFKEKHNLSTDTVESFGAYGGGRAPDGLCGALYAAMYILEKNAEVEKRNELERYFIDQAGAVKCRDIRACKKFSCLDCVEKSSEFLDEHEL